MKNNAAPSEGIPTATTDSGVAYDGGFDRNDPVAFNQRLKEFGFTSLDERPKPEVITQTIPKKLSGGIRTSDHVQIRPDATWTAAPTPRLY